MFPVPGAPGIEGILPSFARAGRPRSRDALDPRDATIPRSRSTGFGTLPFAADDASAVTDDGRGPHRGRHRGGPEGRGIAAHAIGSDGGGSPTADVRPDVGIRGSPRRSDGPGGGTVGEQATRTHRFHRRRACITVGSDGCVKIRSGACGARRFAGRRNFRRGAMTTMWSESRAMVRRICSGTGCIAEAALRRHVGDRDATECSPQLLTTALEGVVTMPPSRRAAEPPSHKSVWRLAAAPSPSGIPA